MANIYTKTMREALQEARDYREPTDVSEGNLSYDEWLKQVKGIEKGAHGINSDEHAKYSKEWKAYANTSESKLTEIVGGRGEMTVTKDGGVMIIKTKDWQTYKAKGWNKKEEVEEKFRWQDILKKKGNVKVGKTDKQGNWHSVSTSDKKELEKLKSQGYEIVDEELEEDCGCGHGSDCGCPSDCDCGCNAVNTEEVEELKEFWPFGKKTKLPKGYNPKPAVKAYDLFHKAYDELKKSGVIDRSGQERLQELYYHLVVNHLGSREAGRLAIKTINGPDRRYGDGKIFQDATR